MERNEEAVFNSALSLTELQDRMAYLDRACAGDVALRARIDSLLNAYDAGEILEPTETLNRHPNGIAPHTPCESIGETIGSYKLVERIGEGGMGMVYLASQAHPVRRKVALKVIKPGMDTKQVIARFEAERQALALMDHPNIAKVLDGGTTPGGRPFFVMDLVRGRSLTEYCDQARVPVAARLRLFVHVCRAVQHAHQKGVIHRDLKPSNVLSP